MPVPIIDPVLQGVFGILKVLKTIVIGISGVYGDILLLMVSILLAYLIGKKTNFIATTTLGTFILGLIIYALLKLVN